MDNFVIKGNLCFSVNPDTIQVAPHSYLVCENGLCAGVFEKLPEKYQNLPVEDYGDRIVIPGMTDLHVHAPQFAFRGLGMDLELLDWLNTYTFPEECKYKDLEYANRAYSSFANHLRRSSTTRAVAFATIHVPATELLMEKMEASGLISYIGKVNMNRNSPDYLCEESTEASLAATEEWICDTQDKFEHTKPILTPRFVPSCTDDLLRGLRGLLEKYHLPVQSHLSENLGEISWVQELCPDTKFYGEAYDRYGLFGGDHKCIMAHCVHSTPEEVALMKKNGVYIAHSPLSNTNLSSGVAPASKYIKEGMNIALASDVAGGDTENLFASIVGAIRASKLRWRLKDQSVKPLTVDQAFYLATMGGGSFFGKVGTFQPGYELDAVVLDDSTLDHPQELDVRSRLERYLYLGAAIPLTAKYVRGSRLF